MENAWVDWCLLQSNTSHLDGFCCTHQHCDDLGNFSATSRRSGPQVIPPKLSDLSSGQLIKVLRRAMCHDGWDICLYRFTYVYIYIWLYVGKSIPNWPDFYIYNSIHPKIITKTCPATLMLRKKSSHFAVNFRWDPPPGRWSWPWPKWRPVDRSWRRRRKVPQPGPPGRAWFDVVLTCFNVFFWRKTTGDNYRKMGILHGIWWDLPSGVIKDGLLDNGPFIGDFSMKPPPCF